MIKFFKVLLVVSSLLSSYAFSYDSPQSSVHFSTEQTPISPASENDASYSKFKYVNADGSPNVFATYVAYLNIASVFYNVFCWKVGHHFITKWDEQMDQKISDDLGGLQTAENILRRTLADIIKRFNNGIGSDNDEFITSGMLEYLNIKKCSVCIDKFVDIVSKELECNDEQNMNRQEFHTFVQNFIASKCSGHNLSLIENSAIPSQELSCPEHCSGWFKRGWHAVKEKWNHPFHWTSLSYALGVAGASAAFAPLISDDNKAGSYVGDMANLINTMVIPTGYAFAVFQHWKNLDREEAKRLVKRIAERFVNIQGILEIGAQVIGKMNNGISIEEARGMYKALMLIHWPEEMVEKFIKVSSQDSSVSIDEFIQALKDIYYHQKISYRDADINAAFSKGQTKLECEIEIDMAALSTLDDEFSL